MEREAEREMEEGETERDNGEGIEAGVMTAVIVARIMTPVIESARQVTGDR
ncbi:hypothetical protein AB0C68_00180 [Streptomyces tendae]|uniref:hypothetical protein n=1 Tax=Streptomyces tendae TaxID=1932 RepID=UPI0026C9B781